MNNPINMPAIMTILIVLAILVSGAIAFSKGQDIDYCKEIGIVHNVETKYFAHHGCRLKMGDKWVEIPQDLRQKS